MDARAQRRLVQESFRRAQRPAKPSKTIPHWELPKLEKAWVTLPTTPPGGPPFCPEDPTEAMTARRDPLSNFRNGVRPSRHH